MKITNLENAPNVPFKLDGRVMFTGPDVEMVHLTLKPGEKMEPHTNPFDVVFFILDGSGKLAVENEVFTLKTNDTIEVKKSISRAWENNTNTILKILVVKIFN